MIKHIKKNSKSKEKIWNGIFIYIKDPLENEVSLDNVLDRVEKEVPKHLLKYVDSIYVGQFKEIIDRDAEALYANGAIYITNKQDSDEDMVDDLVHEIAHSVEDAFKTQIYGDLEIESEFLEKRKELHRILSDEGYNVNLMYYLDVDYNRQFDDFLSQEVGYPMLTALTVNLFFSPYGATSLREYFANGFEGFFHHKNINRLKSLSPKLFDKIKELLYNNEYDYW